MGKAISKPILPAHKRARCSNPARFVTDAKRAFEIGRGGMAPPAWVESSLGLYRRWQAGFRQRQLFVASMDARGKDCRTDYEKSLAKASEEQAQADDALLEKQMAALKDALAEAGIHNLTRKALMAALEAQKRG